MENVGICYGCMKKIDKKENVCPYCGFDGNHYATKFYQLGLGTMLANRYVIGKMLGEGGFGITYIAWDMNLEVPVAVKEYYPNGLVNRDTTTGNRTVFTMEGKKKESFEIGLAKVINEARRMAKFRNLQGIVTVVDFFRENGTAYIVMEFVHGITFDQYLKKNQNKIESQKVLNMFRPLIQSLYKVHQGGIIHRDISPDNIMITDGGEIRLLDFGAARDYGEDEKSLSIMLKRGYAPEEQYRTKGKQGPWTDVYALCATMYKMMTGVTPEESLDRMTEDTLQKLSELEIDIDEKVENILLKGLAVFKKDRIQSMEELYKGLYGRHISDNVEEDANPVAETHKQKAEAAYTLEKLQGAVEDSANNCDMGTVVLFEDSIKEEIQMRQTENTEISSDKSENIDSENVTSVIYSKDPIADYAEESKQQKSVTEEMGKKPKNGEQSPAIDIEQPKEALLTEEADLPKKENNTLVKRIKSKKLFVAIGVIASVLIVAVVLFNLFGSKINIVETGNVVETWYDASGNIQSEAIYDKNENMISGTLYNEDGEVWHKEEYEYDNNGNVVSVTYYEDGEEESKYEHEYEYDNNGNIISEISYRDGEEVSRDEYKYEYDNNGNLISQIVYEGGEEKWKEEYEYDDNGNKVSKMEYTYGVKTKEQEYNESGNIILEIAYEECGDEVGEEKWKCEYEYDNKGNMTLYILNNIYGKSEYKYDNEYDKNGNIISVTEYLDGEVNSVCKYEYK